MTLQRKFLSAQTETLADLRQVVVICSTADIDRAGEVIVQEGIDLSDYQSNPIVLWQHDPNSPIAKAVDIGVVAGKTRAVVQFPPEGTSVLADEKYGLIKAGVINCVSIGFDPIETEPMDAARPRGPQRYLKSALMEFSFVSVPANTGANIVARSTKSDTPSLKVGASRTLPIDMETAWDGPAAEASIFDHAAFDGEDPDSSFARKGFLAYDSANTDLKGSYKLPFAKVIDGRLTAFASGIRAAASRLPQADLPDDVATKARAVIDHYEAEMTDKAAVTPKTKDATPFKIKGLYDLAQFAYLLEQLGWIKDCAEWEAAIEEDGSALPAMLGDLLTQAGAAFLAMAKEEVAELVGGEDADLGGLPEEDVAIVTAGKTPAIQKYRAALVKTKAVIKAGRKLSASTVQIIKDAVAMHDDAAGLHKQGAAKTKSASALLSDLLDSASTSDTTDDPNQGDDTPTDEAEFATAKRQREIDILRLGAIAA